MEKENLIKKLEEIKVPEIEIPGHKEKLKAVLLEKYLQEKRKGEVFGILFRLVPVGAATIICFGLILSNIIIPNYNLAKAREIALQNPEIRGWIEKGATIKDIKVVQNQAYVLIQPKEEKKEIPVAIENEAVKLAEGGVIAGGEFNGALAEINIKKNQVSKLEKLDSKILSLAEEKKAKTEDIARRDPEIPKEAEILNIEVSIPSFKLIQKGNSVQVLPEPIPEEESLIIYRLDRKQWQGKVDLIEERVKELEFLGEIQNGATPGE